MVLLDDGTSVPYYAIVLVPMCERYALFKKEIVDGHMTSLVVLLS